jgi:hypothetical protein
MTSALIGTARMIRGPAWRRIRTGKGRAARAGEAGGDAMSDETMMWDEVADKRQVHACGHQLCL